MPLPHRASRITRANCWQSPVFVDPQINLGTCKRIEAVLKTLQDDPAQAGQFQEGFEPPRTTDHLTYRPTRLANADLRQQGIDFAYLRGSVPAGCYVPSGSR